MRPPTTKAKPKSLRAAISTTFSPKCIAMALSKPRTRFDRIARCVSRQIQSVRCSLSTNESGPPPRTAAITCVFVILTSVISHNQGIHGFVSGDFHQSKMDWNGVQQAKDKIRSNRKVMVSVTAPADIRPCPGSELIIADFCLVLKTMSDDVRLQAGV